MKKFLKLCVLPVIFSILLTATVFGAEPELPMAGAERVFNAMPVTYVYEPELWNGTAAGNENTDEADASATDEEEAEDTVEAPDEETEETADTSDAEDADEETQDSETEDTSTAAAVPNNRVVCIDPGHQLKGDSTKEPIGPGAAETKAKVASGTTGAATGVPEYQLTLDVALKLQAELESRGYQVVMCRTTNNVNISNSERAAVANNAGAGAFLRLHANGASSAGVSGAETLAPSTSNPYCASIAAASQTLSKCVLDCMCAASGATNRGVKIYDNMSGINWSKVPVTIVEMGYMTNPAEDQAMQNSDYQAKLVKGMADGVDKFFGL